MGTGTGDFDWQREYTRRQAELKSSSVRSIPRTPTFLFISLLRTNPAAAAVSQSETGFSWSQFSANTKKYGASEKKAGRQMFSEYLQSVQDLVGVTSGETASVAKVVLHLIHLSRRRWAALHPH